MKSPLLASTSVLHRCRFVSSFIWSGCLAALGSSFVIAQGGSLTPPGAPGVLFKTLNEVEPRTPISALPFTISAGGSYYLTGSLAVTTGNAITINVDNVTLDLNGFTLSSTASSASGTAVLISGTRKNITIKNGHIRGTTTYSAPTFTTGGFLDGVGNASGSSDNIRIADLNIHGMASDGIHLAINSDPTFVVERCNVMVCGGFGIVAGVVRDCNVETASQSGVYADVAINCIGTSVRTMASSAGIVGLSIVENCKGIADASGGITGGQVSNSVGISVSGIGVDASNASNCSGTSTSGIGLIAGNATNSMGTSTSGSFGMSVLGTASYCRGKRDGGVAISAPIAIGCTVNGTGTVTSASKHLGTP